MIVPEPCVCGHTDEEHTSFGDCAHRDTWACRACGGDLLRLDVIGQEAHGRCIGCGRTVKLGPVCDCSEFVERF